MNCYRTFISSLTFISNNVRYTPIPVVTYIPFALSIWLPHVVKACPTRLWQRHTKKTDSKAIAVGLSGFSSHFNKLDEIA